MKVSECYEAITAASSSPELSKQPGVEDSIGGEENTTSEQSPLAFTHC